MDRVGDPTSGFTDMQWYMYHQRNVAFFAAFSASRLSDDDLLRSVRGFVELAPQLQTGYRGADPGAPRPLAPRPTALIDAIDATPPLMTVVPA